MLQIAAARAALVKKLLLIRHPVTIGIAVGVQIERVRLADNQAVIQRQQNARQQQLIDEHRVLVELPVAVGVHVLGHAADLVELA